MSSSPDRAIPRKWSSRPVPLSLPAPQPEELGQLVPAQFNSDWQVVLHNPAQNSVVLYHPTTRQLAVSKNTSRHVDQDQICPMCKQTVPSFEYDSSSPPSPPSAESGPSPIIFPRRVSRANSTSFVLPSSQPFIHNASSSSSSISDQAGTTALMTSRPRRSSVPALWNDPSFSSAPSSSASSVVISSETASSSPALSRSSLLHLGENARRRGSAHEPESLYPVQPVQPSFALTPYIAPNYFKLIAASSPVSDGLGWDSSSPSERDARPDHDRNHGRESAQAQDREEHREEESINQSNGLPRSSLSSLAFNTGYYARFFKEDRKIGSGGFGGVWLAHHVLDGINLGTYAVKKIPVGDSREWLAKVLKEVTALERLHHPNIVDYKHSWLEMHRPSDFGPEVPCLFLLMEYANAGTLADLIWPKLSVAAQRRAKRDGKETQYMAEDEIWRLFIDTCLGLRHLHRLGIVHRDLKPENLLLTTEAAAESSSFASSSRSSSSSSARQFRVLVSDFGQSSMAGRPYVSTGNTGTLLYAAPETLRMTRNRKRVAARTPECVEEEEKKETDTDTASLSEQPALKKASKTSSSSPSTSPLSLVVSGRRPLVIRSVDSDSDADDLSVSLRKRKSADYCDALSPEVGERRGRKGMRNAQEAGQVHSAEESAKQNKHEEQGDAQRSRSRSRVTVRKGKGTPFHSAVGDQEESHHPNANADAKPRSESDATDEAVRLEKGGDGEEMIYQEQCDLWSLGMILYAMAYSTLPYSSQTTDALYEEIMTKPLTFPSSPHRSPELMQLIKKLLSVDPDRRPSVSAILNYAAMRAPQEAYKIHNLSSPVMRPVAPSFAHISPSPSPDTRGPASVSSSSSPFSSSTASVSSSRSLIVQDSEPSPSPLSPSLSLFPRSPSPEIMESRTPSPSLSSSPHLRSSSAYDDASQRSLSSSSAISTSHATSSTMSSNGRSTYPSHLPARSRTVPSPSRTASSSIAHKAKAPKTPQLASSSSSSPSFSSSSFSLFSMESEALASSSSLPSATNVAEAASSSQRRRIRSIRFAGGILQMIGILLKVWLLLGECDPVRPSYLFFFASLGLALLSLWNGSSVFASSSSSNSSSEADPSPYPAKSSPSKRHPLALPPPSLSRSPSSSTLSSASSSEQSQSSSTPSSSFLSSLVSRFNLSSTFSVTAFRCLAALLAFLVSVGFMTFFPNAVCCGPPMAATISLHHRGAGSESIQVSPSRSAAPLSVRSAVVAHMAVLFIQLCGVLAEAGWFSSIPRLFSSLSSSPPLASSAPSTNSATSTPATSASTSERSSGWSARPTLALPAPVHSLSSSSHPNHKTRSSLREAK